jgi:3-phytase/alkaline phosphatase D
MRRHTERTFALGLLPLMVAASLYNGESLAADSVRFATFNASLNRDASGQLLSDLANPAGADLATTVGKRIQQIHNVAEIIQRANPDVLLVNEFDFDFNGTPTASGTAMVLGYSSEAAKRFQDNFLSASHNLGGAATSPLHYSWRHTPNTNTGLASGFDLNNNGVVSGGDDAFGFGNYAGQYGFTIYSKHEIVNVRSFQNFKWKDMPGNLLTNDPVAGANNLANFYSPAEIDALRLSSKNHVDVTVRINGQDVHFLSAHPTPPTFDGAEDRNGKRNHDEIRFWADYVNGETYIYDDQGGTGGLPAGARFVIAGDYNADPNDGDSFKGLVNGVQYNAIGQLLNHTLVSAAITPAAHGGVEAATLPSNNGTANQGHTGDPAFDTADFNDAAPGNLRVDYVLPSANLNVEGAGIFWPTSQDAAWPLVGTFRSPYNLYANYSTSDHKLVWVDVSAPVPEPETYALLLAGLGLVGFAARRRKAA